MATDPKKPTGPAQPVSVSPGSGGGNAPSGGPAQVPGAVLPVPGKTPSKPTIKPGGPGTHPKDPGFGVHAPTGNFEDYLKGEDRDAYLALNALFSSYGLGSLAKKIYSYIVQGNSADTIKILLQQTDEWKKRFAGNEKRRAMGAPVLSPEEYLATESAYRELLRAGGLPSGFYDQPDDFSNWIGNSVSPTELKQRVDQAVAATSQANPYYKQALASLYGIQEKDLTAYWLDPGRAAPLLQKQAAAAAIGAEALRQGLTTTSQRAEDLATQGVTQQQAQQGYQWISDTFNAVRSIAQRYGEDWTQIQAEQDVFGQSAAQAQRRKRLTAQEQGLFSGGAGSSVGGLSTGGYSQT